MGTMGNPSSDWNALRYVNISTEQAVYRERTTGFEPATLTLGKGDVAAPLSLLHSAERALPRLFVRPVRRVGSSPAIYV
jgi:hypothetical protein